MENVDAVTEILKTLRLNVPAEKSVTCEGLLSLFK